MTRTDDRIHYLDNLRAWAMLLGVVFHAGLAYAEPAQQVWLATDRYSSVVLDAVMWFLHLFRMPLFFLLSGYFAALLIERRGIQKFLWNRMLRIAAPLVLFFPFLYAAMAAVFVMALSMDYEKHGLMGWIAANIDSGQTSSEESSVTWMHLWFLVYLIMFSLLAAAGAAWVRPRANGWRLQSSLRMQRWLWALAPLVLVPSILVAGVPMPAAEALWPMIWPFGFYGPFYWAGWRLFGREEVLLRLEPACCMILISGLVLYLPYYFYLPVIDLEIVLKGKSNIAPWTAIMEAILTAYLAVLLTLAALLFGRRYLAGHSRAMRFVADASYWTYLVHLPIVLLLQTLMVPLDWNVWIKLSAVIGITILFCLATYIVFVRYTPVGWLLNGKRSFP